MRQCFFVAALSLLVLVVATNSFGKSSNASVGGFAQDSTGAYVPGVTITATNTGTGIVTTALTNESGTYNFPSLLPGTYRISAELTGFRPHIYNDVQLGANTAARYNFTLAVGGVSQAVEVVASTTSVLAESSATIGQVLNEKAVTDLPLVSNNV